jgi:CheY-like chemotaxis protein
MGHIVAADDDPDMRAVVERTLTRAGHTVGLCKDGEELVAETKATHPDAVVTDNEMPVMTGLQARTELAATPQTADIPVVMATGSVTPEEAAEILRDGDQLVRKPFRPAQLRDAVHAAMTQRQLRPGG